MGTRPNEVKIQIVLTHADRPKGKVPALQIKSEYRMVTVHLFCGG